MMMNIKNKKRDRAHWIMSEKSAKALIIHKINWYTSSTCTPALGNITLICNLFTSHAMYMHAIYL